MEDFLKDFRKHLSKNILNEYLKIIGGISLTFSRNVQKIILKIKISSLRKLLKIPWGNSKRFLYKTLEDSEKTRRISHRFLKKSPKNPLSDFSKAARETFLRLLEVPYQIFSQNAVWNLSKVSGEISCKFLDEPH